MVKKGKKLGKQCSSVWPDPGAAHDSVCFLEYKTRGKKHS